MLAATGARPQDAPARTDIVSITAFLRIYEKLCGGLPTDKIVDAVSVGAKLGGLELEEDAVRAEIEKDEAEKTAIMKQLDEEELRERCSQIEIGLTNLGNEAEGLVESDKAASKAERQAQLTPKRELEVQLDAAFARIKAREEQELRRVNEERARIKTEEQKQERARAEQAEQERAFCGVLTSYATKWDDLGRRLRAEPNEIARKRLSDAECPRLIRDRNDALDALLASNDFRIQGWTIKFRESQNL
jgi:hypothetical protein